LMCASEAGIQLLLFDTWSLGQPHAVRQLETSWADTGRC
jgi:hypothetical protein